MLTYRIRCPHCGSVVNISNSECPQCHGSIIPVGMAYIDLYRMGNFVGSAAGLGIYIDGEPLGYIGNRESLRVCVPFGVHTIHIAAQMARKCNDLTFQFTPEQPLVCIKVSTVVGFWANSFKLEQVPASEMPEFEPIPM